MIIETAILSITPTRESQFEEAMTKAQSILKSMTGYLGHELLRGVDEGITSQYLLMIRWRTLEDHTVGFRLAPEHKEWKDLLGPFYAAPAQVTHYGEILGHNSPIQINH
jgi:heme-degrading monooxygenase HmoA